MVKSGKRKKGLPSKSASASSTNPDRTVSAKAKRSGGSTRDKATINRLNMYRGSRVVRNVSGKVVGGELLDRNTAGGKEITAQSGRIAPDRRWFGNTRTIGQTELDKFRAEMRTVAANPYQVILHRKKVPVGLVKDEALIDEKETKKAAEKNRARAKRRELLDHEPFAHTFCGSAGGTHTRKRPKLGGLLGGLEALAARARERQEDYDSVTTSDGSHLLNTGGTDARTLEAEQFRQIDGARQERSHDLFAKGQSRRIWAELYKVLDCSDVVLHVLDARDVPGTRCERVISHVKSKIGAKHLVFVLNKCDLVPNWVVKRWLSELAKTAPCIAFRASRTKPFGKSAVLDVLKQFAKLKRDAKQISVGIVGAPNVGKSSLINALRNKVVCKAAPIAGETKVWQYVSLTKRINLIDSPGVVYDKDKGTEADAVLRGVVRAERLPDPDIFVPHLILRCHDLDHIHNTYGHGLLSLSTERHHQAQANSDPQGAAHELEQDAALFLKNLAHKMGRLLPGGEPDVITVAKMLINDWQRGKIPHFVPPPNYDAKDAADVQDDEGHQQEDEDNNDNEEDEE
mmetsp:Transcript_10429/g.14398  ORF Transcript_10429/g.14398 Transcript_10429/m.14398 type:complete len:571 (+) Transcript_10429:65-1777(+)|eukprot:CAMPEP_0197315848 /NCGR_PEP_ID=MMETSP0891-20130614/39618_1 /TAXON_ID=44058 ORGANISM="Aureoumbra lagunensis, Strain CCMP1510" /NCGR_SAMPLE_ID=MMETSP0891 /ASSEMBLY_ACC=CAM_ASM_000534 /LENGTH=570 /DNA_ID=CAMNT_0042805003 /DNA_START=52 /DNA_END=1764 /DNA_ORIENTATION=+